MAFPNYLKLAPYHIPILIHNSQNMITFSCQHLNLMNKTGGAYISFIEVPEDFEGLLWATSAITLVNAPV